MRIALLTWESLHSIAVGGVAVHVTELAAALERKGHEVHVFTRMRWAGDWQYVRIDGVHYHRVPYAGASDIVDDVNNMCRGFVSAVFATEDYMGEALTSFTPTTGWLPTPWSGSSKAAVERGS